MIETEKHCRLLKEELHILKCIFWSLGGSENNIQRFYGECISKQLPYYPAHPADMETLTNIRSHPVNVTPVFTHLLTLFLSLTPDKNIWLFSKYVLTFLTPFGVDCVQWIERFFLLKAACNHDRNNYSPDPEKNGLHLLTAE